MSKNRKKKILYLITIIIIPSALLILNINNDFYFIDSLFGWNKFDSVVRGLSLSSPDDSSIKIMKNDKIFPPFLKLIESNNSFIRNYDKLNKNKIISIQTFKSNSIITDYGPDIGKSYFVPPNTRVNITYDPSVIDPRELGFDSVPNGAVLAWPIGTVQDIQNWNINYKIRNRDLLINILSLLSIIVGATILVLES